MHHVRQGVLLSLMLVSLVALFTGTARASTVRTPVQTSTAYVLTINGQNVSSRLFVLSDSQQRSVIYNLTVNGATLAYLIRRDSLTGCPVGQPFPKSCLILQDLGLLHPTGNWGINLLSTTAYQSGQSQQYIVLWPYGSYPNLIGNWIIAQYRILYNGEQIAGNQVNLS